MTTSDAEAPLQLGTEHEALGVFLGKWRAEGTTFGGPNQSPEHPKADAVPWTSTHTARWHTGKFFLIQDERASSRGPFDTLSIMGVDAQSGTHFARSFENHGFTRLYEVTVRGNVWTFNGEHERARIVFSNDGDTQTITWEWRPKDRWLPLCDRVAHKER
jgi:hypothetical protein